MARRDSVSDELAPCFGSEFNGRGRTKPPELCVFRYAFIFTLTVVLFALAAIVAAPPASAAEPVAALSFDEGKGSTARDSANLHDATIHGAEWTEGKYGSALEFNGEGDYLSIPDSDDLDFTNEFTLEAWVKPQGAQNQAPVSR